MIRVFSHYLHRRTLMHMAFDFVMILIAVGSAALTHVHKPELVTSIVVGGVLVLGICMLAINSASGLYRQSHSRSLNQSVWRAVLALFAGLPLAYGIFSIASSDVVGGDAIKWSAMLGVTAVLVHRVYAAHAAGRSIVRTRVLIYGSGAAARLIGTTIKSVNPHTEIVGYLAGPNEDEPHVPADQLLNSTKSLTNTARSLNVNEIVVALTERRGGSMPMRELLDCKLYQIRVCDIATYFERTLGQIKVDYTYAGWLIFGEGFNQGVMRSAFKRACDVVWALTLIVLAAPLMLLTALLISLDSAGPILYRQSRVGLNGKPFNVTKFRSMRLDAEKDGTPRLAAEKDDRVTRLGRIMRKYRIDELPQLFNVLKGEMSLVGPRPERPYFVERFTRKIPYYAVRHSVKPGVTGWAQVRFHYGSTDADTQEKLQYDLYYVKNHSLMLDLIVMFETVLVVLMGKGAR